MVLPMLPETFGLLLAAFVPCFGAASYRNFQWLVGGWVHCLGRHTITNVAVASGAIGLRHVSVFHRFFGRAKWQPDRLGQVVFQMALRWLPDGLPLTVLGDDTLARKHGKCVSLASMHHDPLLSTARKPFFSFGHNWVVLALWVPLPIGRARGFALPILWRLFTGNKRGGKADAPSRKTAGKRLRAAEVAHANRDRRTKLELLRELVDLVAGWAGERTVYLACDSASAGRVILENRPANVQVISRLRPDAALWTPAPKSRPGRTGRPRKRGVRLPTPKALAAARRHCQPVTVTVYGQTVRTQVFVLRALWYGALRDHPVRIVLVRDPTGRRKDEAFFCTDLTVDAVFILEASARRWSLEVTFHDCKQCLGLAEPQSQSPQAVQRTAPFAFLVYDLVLLWFAEHVATSGAPLWVARPWYRHKTAPSFLDMLTTLRHAGWQTARPASLFEAAEVPAAPPKSARPASLSRSAAA